VDETAFSLRRWFDRFKSEQRVVAEQRPGGRAPDATVDEVGAAADNVGFHGQPIRSRVGNGQGSGDPSSPGWAGWGASGGGW
jgi:hypothetical protein